MNSMNANEKSSMIMFLIETIFSQLLELGVCINKCLLGYLTGTNVLEF